MKNVFKTITLVAIAMMAFTQVSTAQTVDDIINKYVNAIGGEDRINNIKTVRMSITAEYGVQLKGTIYQKMPNLMRTDVVFQNVTITFAAYDGTTAWSKNPMGGGDKAQKAEAETTLEMSEDVFPTPLYKYQDHKYKATLEGQEVIEGVACYKIKMTSPSGADSYYFVDAENYVPIMVRSFIRAGEGKGKAIESYFSDYQEVEGVMMPFATTQKADGEIIGSSTVTKVEINPADFDEKIFAFPGN